MRFHGGFMQLAHSLLVVIVILIIAYFRKRRQEQEMEEAMILEEQREALQCGRYQSGARNRSYSSQKATRKDGEGQARRIC